MEFMAPIIAFFSSLAGLNFFFIVTIEKVAGEAGALIASEFL